MLEISAARYLQPDPRAHAKAPNDVQGWPRLHRRPEQGQSSCDHGTRARLFYYGSGPSAASQKCTPTCTLVEQTQSPQWAKLLLLQYGPVAQPDRAAVS